MVNRKKSPYQQLRYDRRADKIDSQTLVLVRQPVRGSEGYARAQSFEKSIN